MIAELMSMKWIGATITKALGGISIGTLGFVIGENLSGNLWVAIIISAVCQVIFGWLTNRPKMVSASSQAEILARQQSMSEWAALLKAQQDAANEQAIRQRKQIEAKDTMMAVMRITKHNAMDAYGAACLHIQLLESMLKDANQTIPPFKMRTTKEITGVEDDEVLRLVNNGK